MTGDRAPISETGVVDTPVPTRRQGVAGVTDEMQDILPATGRQADGAWHWLLAGAVAALVLGVSLRRKERPDE